VRSQKSFEDLQKANVANLNPVLLDVCDDQSVAKALSALQKRDGTLHALINNAGIAVGGPIEALPMSEWQRQFECNFFGVIRVTKACLPLLRESKGRVVNISSISGRVAAPFLSPYSTSKFALESFSDSLRRELRPFGVKVAVIEPGAIATPIWNKSQQEALADESPLDTKIMEAYAAQAERFRKFIEDLTRSAEPVSLVIQAIEHALNSRSPKTRYTVGRGIALSSLMAGVMPDRVMDAFMRRRF
jgi:NAD(P)-dependent dehydrogenase (short-subunit alcohol dehydrogenase family)